MSFKQLSVLQYIIAGGIWSHTVLQALPDLPQRMSRQRVKHHHVLWAHVGALQSDPPSTLSALLDSYFGLQCTDPRDRIYAFLPLIDWKTCSLSPILPDYTKTDFELASQAIKYVPLFRADSLLLSLGVPSTTPAMQTLIRQIRDGKNCGFKANSRRRTYRLNTSRVIREIEAGDRNLTAGITRHEVIFGGLDDQRRQKLRDLNQLPEVMAARANASNSQPLLVGSETAALVCKEARAGDLLLPLSSYDLGRLLMVVRHDSGVVYNIVGQGFLFSGYTFCDKFIELENAERDYTRHQSCFLDHVCGCVGGPKHDMLRADKDIDLTAQKAMVLIGQDFVEPGLWSFDPWRRLQRLTMPWGRMVKVPIALPMFIAILESQ